MPKGDILIPEDVWSAEHIRYKMFERDNLGEKEDATEDNNFNEDEDEGHGDPSASIDEDIGGENLV